jgi:putative addiction module killer protein
MIQLRKTERFTHWIDSLRDAVGRARIQARIARLAAGNAGDVKPIGKGVSELRIDVGPGYRVYYMQRGEEFILLLAGGNKSTQQKDIQLALSMAQEAST